MRHILHKIIVKCIFIMSWIKVRLSMVFAFLALKIIRTGEVPRHVAFIIDGNRRYAEIQKIPRNKGHVKGLNNFLRIISLCKDLGIKEITVYAFSIDNFKRTKKEVDNIMNIIKRFFDNIDKLVDAGVCIRVIGNLSYLREDILKSIARAIITSKDNNKLILNVACAYTSRDELTHAIKEITMGIMCNDILLEDITENLISDCLYTYKSSNLDLLIRTSGEVRLSDFLMWQVSTACLYFTNTLWPEFDLWDLLRAIFYYQTCYSDLQKIRNNSKTLVPNTRVSKFVDKLHRKREIMIKNIYKSSVQYKNK